jgi:hypothetical protein
VIGVCDRSWDSPSPSFGFGWLVNRIRERGGGRRSREMTDGGRAGGGAGSGRGAVIALDSGLVFVVVAVPYVELELEVMEGGGLTLVRILGV